jgi:hypothetical protein
MSFSSADPPAEPDATTIAAGAGGATGFSRIARRNSGRRAGEVYYEQTTPSGGGSPKADRFGMARQVVARFEAERQALAPMDHPPSRWLTADDA